MFDWKEIAKQLLGMPFVQKLINDFLARLFKNVPAGTSPVMGGFTQEQIADAAKAAIDAQ